MIRAATRPEWNAGPESHGLLQELRVAGIGIQVLFGFLLSLPFTMTFSELDTP